MTAFQNKIEYMQFNAQEIISMLIIAIVIRIMSNPLGKINVDIDGNK